MQILHPFAGSVQHYSEEIADPDRYRPDHCPQCRLSTADRTRLLQPHAGGCGV